jgi:UDP-N-acetylmuramoyl-L-alanyl-D-glutamate--2,6-diaminopimelate ligase
VKLFDLVEGVALKEVRGDLGVKIQGLTKDSREVEPGYLFFATKKSAPFISEVLERGAVAVVSEGTIFEGFQASIIAEDLQGLMGRLAARYYNLPSLKMSLIAITGTNGKTTTSYIIESILKAAGRKVGVIGTISHRYNGHEVVARNTTPGATEIQLLLSEMSHGGMDNVVMEVSSHALDQKRVAGIEFDVAILTNVTHDHLDYHQTFENYKAAKALLFTRYLRESTKVAKYAILNRDDPEALYFVPGEPVQTVYYSLSQGADAYLIRCQEDLSGLQLEVSIMEKRFTVSSPLIGTVNVPNLLAAALYGVVAGLPVQAIQKGCVEMTGVPGRLERVQGVAGPAVFIDYAHTPDALRKVLEILNRLKRGRLIVVFGCGGDRDRAKRPMMGRIASEMAEFTIVTSDNPRSENPETIINEIETGLVGAQYKIERDRRKAILEAIAMAQVDDLVLIAGKGHENYQIIGSTSLYFSDREVAEEALRVAHR